MKKKLFLLASLLILVVLFFTFDLGQIISFENIKDKQNELLNYKQQNPLLSPLLFFSAYVVLTGLSLPGALALTILGGALFGLAKGLLIVSFASVLGASFAFILARYLAKDWLQKKYKDSLQKLNLGITNDGGFYLFSLRLVPAFPFFLINLLMGLTPISLKQYFWVSWVGMLPGTFVYILAGTQLAQINSPKDIFSLPIILSFTAIGLLPLALKKFYKIKSN